MIYSVEDLSNKLEDPTTTTTTTTTTTMSISAPFGRNSNNNLVSGTLMMMKPSFNESTSWTMFSESYPVGEMVWGFILLLGIFGVNGSVLWVVGKSRELWKPRHLWMACLCVTDLFVGGHKCLELLLLIWPQRELCVLQRATLGIPYVVNMLLLTLLSLDRFVAVRYPFYYSSSISNRHVLIGFLLVLMAGSSLAGASVTLGLRDPICRAQSLQLVYLTIVLTICSILTLLFNSSVLRIAKRQLNAIYAHEPIVNSRRRVSLFCTNCGHKNATFVNTLVPAAGPFVTDSTTTTTTNGGPPGSSNGSSESSNNGLSLETRKLASQPLLPLALPLPLSLPEALILSPTDLDLQYHTHNNNNNNHSSSNNLSSLSASPPHQMGVIGEDPSPLSRMEAFPLTLTESASGGGGGGGGTRGGGGGGGGTRGGGGGGGARVHIAEGNALDEINSHNPPTLVRTLSLPTLPDSITLIVPPDPIMPPTAILLANSAADIMENTVNIKSAGQGMNGSGAYPHTITVALPRSRSFSCSKKSPPEVNSPGRHHQLFRNLHFSRSHMFHVGRLFPSIRFARTVLLIMIPMWVFILPIVTIIPLHRGCSDPSGSSELNCEIVNKLWAYLLIHMRSVLPIQAILDTLIYACGSKEFRHCFQKLVHWHRTQSRIK